MKKQRIGLDGSWLSGKHCVCNAPEGLERALRLSKQRRWDGLSKRLCHECANAKYNGKPLVFSVRQGTSDVQCWETWSAAGADMCVRSKEGWTILEDCVSIWNTMGMGEGTHTIGTFESLVRFFLMNHPDIVFEAMLPKRLPYEHRSCLHLQVTLFRNAVQHELDQRLPEAIATLAMDYFWYDRISFGSHSAPQRAVFDDTKIIPVAEGRVDLVKESLVANYRFALQEDTLGVGDPQFQDVNPVPFAMDGFRPDLIEKATDHGQALYYASCYDKISHMKEIVKLANRYEEWFRRWAGVAMCRAILTGSRRVVELCIYENLLDRDFQLCSVSPIREERFLFRLMGKAKMKRAHFGTTRNKWEMEPIDVSLMSIAKYVSDAETYKMLVQWNPLPEKQTPVQARWDSSEYLREIEQYMGLAKTEL